MTVKRRMKIKVWVKYSWQQKIRDCLLFIVCVAAAFFVSMGIICIFEKATESTPSLITLVEQTVYYYDSLYVIPKMHEARDAICTLCSVLDQPSLRNTIVGSDYIQYLQLKYDCENHCFGDTIGGSE